MEDKKIDDEEEEERERWGEGLRWSLFINTVRVGIKLPRSCFLKRKNLLELKVCFGVFCLVCCICTSCVDTFLMRLKLHFIVEVEFEFYSHCRFSQRFGNSVIQLTLQTHKATENHFANNTQENNSPEKQHLGRKSRVHSKYYESSSVPWCILNRHKSSSDNSVYAYGCSRKF